MLPVWVTAPIAIACFLALAWLERRRPLRASTEPKLRREARNLAVAATGAISILLAETPFILPLVEMLSEITGVSAEPLSAVAGEAA